MAKDREELKEDRSRISLAIVFFLLALVWLIAFAFGELVEVEAEGEAYMSEIDTQKAVEERALNDARRKAIEKAQGVFIRSHTLVSKAQLTDDLVFATVRGRIVKEEVLSKNWNWENRIHRVKIRAWVEPVYPERGETISITLFLSKVELKEGEEVKIFYQTDKPCYVYIFSIAHDGSVTLLFPNSFYRDNYTEPNKVYEFPPKNSPLKLKAMLLPNFKGEVAEERIKIIAIKKKTDILPLGFQEGLFKVYDASSTGLTTDLALRLNQLEPSEWAEAQVVYKILNNWR